MKAKAEEPLYKVESRQIIGSAMEVLNEVGHGLHEKPYENALIHELGLRGLACQQQLRFEVLYKGQRVGEYIPDLIVCDKVIVDTKVVENITDREIGQMMNYLKITGYRLGYIINFKHPKLDWKRVII